MKTSEYKSYDELPLFLNAATASIQCGELQVDIHARADAEMIQTIIRALKSC